MSTNDDTSRQPERQAFMEVQGSQEGTPGTQFTDFDNTSGFWRGEHATPGSVRLVSGDVPQFNADLTKCKARTAVRVRKIERNRFLLATTWPEAMLLVDKWCNDSLIYDADTEEQ